MAAGCINHTSIPIIEQGRSGFLRAVSMYHDAFPDIGYSVDDLFADGDRVAVRVTLRGTHKGEFLGIPPTGKQLNVSGIGIYRIADGKIAEVWGLRDHIGTMPQLGVTHQLAEPVG